MNTNTNTNTNANTDTNSTDTNSNTAAVAPAARRSRRPMRWLLAALTLTAVGLGGLAATENVAGASTGTASGQVCIRDQYGPVRNATISSYVSVNRRAQLVDSVKTGPQGCGWVKFRTNSTVKFTARAVTGNCSFYCFVTGYSSGWLNVGGVPGHGYRLGTATVQTQVIDSGYQQAQQILSMY